MSFEFSFNLPKHWNSYYLSDIASDEKKSIISGPFGSNISSKFFVDNGIPVIRGSNLSVDISRFWDEGFVYLTEEKAEELNSWAIRDDIVITAAGTLGQINIIPNDSKYEKYVISNKQMRLRVNKKMVLPLYSFYWLKNKYMVQYIINQNTGSTIPLINLGILRRLPIALPPKNEQEKIVSILSSLDNKIQLNNRMNKVVEQMAQVIFKHWFIDFEFPNENGMSYKSSGGEMVFCEKMQMDIPKGWLTVKLSDLGNIVTGRTPSAKDPNHFGNEYNFITPKDIKDTQYIIKSERLLSEIGSRKLKTNRIKKNSIGISCIGSNLGEVYINAKDGYTNQQINSIVLYNEELYPFMYIMLKNMKLEFLNLAGGSAVPIINKSTFSAIEVIKPCEAVIHKFIELVAGMFETIKTNLILNNNLIEIRDTLLPKLMSGEVDVTEVEL